MGQGGTEGEYYEGRYINQDESAKFARLALIINGLGLAIGVPMFLWSIHMLGHNGSPWVAIGTFVGTVVTEVVGTSILLRKT